MQVLPEVLNSMPSQFALKLAVFASRKGLLNLEKWLEEEVSIYRDSFASVCCLLPPYSYSFFVVSYLFKSWFSRDCVTNIDAVEAVCRCLHY